MSCFYVPPKHSSRACWAASGRQLSSLAVMPQHNLPCQHIPPVHARLGVAKLPPLSAAFPARSRWRRPGGGHCRLHQGAQAAHQGHWCGADRCGQNVDIRKLLQPIRVHSVGWGWGMQLPMAASGLFPLLSISCQLHACWTGTGCAALFAHSAPPCRSTSGPICKLPCPNRRTRDGAVLLPV